MKSSLVPIALAAALASAQNQAPGDGVPYNCAKPNAQYCIADDIILRCNETAIGYPGRCSANLSGYPPAGGTASCWQSGEETGDAACVKNCVVYAEEPFTLPADECTPSATTSVHWNTTMTTQTTSSEEVITDPILTSTSTLVITDPIHNTTYTTITQCPGGCPPPTITDGPTNTPIPPPSPTSATTTSPTGAAAANKVGGVLAAVGLAAACLL